MRVSDNGRYLVEEDGVPFFFLGENCWSLFFAPSRDDIDLYLHDRRDKGFNVIMPVLLRWSGLPETTVPDRRRADTMRNITGESPLIDLDPSRPNEAFFRHVDWVMDRAEALGLCMGLLPTWGEFVGPRSQTQGPHLFNQSNACAYGRFLGRRYRDRRIIWHLGGDRNPLDEETLGIWRAMAEGLDEGDGGRHLVTYHPGGGASSSQWLHAEPWLDINMMQTSTRYAPDNYNWILADYNRRPAKPVIDGETRYENSHVDFHHKTGSRVGACEVRRTAFYALLSGAAGHTYGCRDVWSFHVPQDEVEPERDVDLHWRQALHLAGATQVGMIRRFFERYPWYRLVPDQLGDFVVEGAGGIPRPHQEREHRMNSGLHDPYVAAARADNGSFAVVYVPDGQPISVNLAVMSAELVKALWFNPHNGTYQTIGDYPAGGRQGFAPPHTDPDWVLVLERIN